MRKLRFAVFFACTRIVDQALIGTISAMPLIPVTGGRGILLSPHQTQLSRPV
jgi:hypothetical protein